ncbi:MAG: hypothetical protein JNK61_07535 [Bacteroidia bacterium]|nr:hypothetical protein [Bacteroidia bacterium]HQV00358.1 hypothetical protein [Bacteroidia bacterium]
MSQKVKLQVGFIALLIFLAAFSRVIPHMLNFSPLAAIGLFGAAHFSKKWLAFVIPLAATWLSDLFINNVIYGQYYDGFVWFYDGFHWQYGSYAFITLLALPLFSKITAGRVATGSLMATVVFFLVSNFGCWVGSVMYAPDASGLTACYIAGLPFLKGTFMGDVFYSTVLFGGYYLLQNRYSAFKLSHVTYN